MPVNAFQKSIYTNDSNIDYFQKLDISDGSWTLQDTLGFIQSSGNDGTDNFITLNAVASGTDDYSPTGNGGGVTNAPRWYKLAYYDDGTPVLAGDQFQITMVTDMQGTTGGNLRYFNWSLGFAQDPTSSSIGTLNHNGAGIAWNFANTDADVFSFLITGAASSNGSPLSPDDTKSYNTLPVVGGQCNITNVSTDPAGAYKSWEAFRSITGPYTGQVSLMLIAGMRGSSRSYNSGDQTKLRINYKISKLNTGEL
jgi:hypothetical protein